MKIIRTIFATIFLINLIKTENEAEKKKPPKVAWQNINLPKEHLPYYFNSNKSLRKRCLNDDDCPFKAEANPDKAKCWGYEKDCLATNRTLEVTCSGDSGGWTSNKNEQIEKFWTQGDFGYLKERLGEMKTYCKGSNPGDSNLECVDHTRMCRGKNIYFDFKNLGALNSNDRYREDIFKPGQVGGRCKFNAHDFFKQGTHKSPLQSWYSELQTFREFKNPVNKEMCEKYITEPVILIKLDAGVNMYHHFCDFVNLYLTQHANNKFFQNVRIVYWDTSSSSYWSFFSDMWKVFSNKKPIQLKEFEGKRVCFKDVTFSFLARMRYGMFYNMPLIYGCQNTGFFKAFSEHSLHRFKVKQNGPLMDKLRITLLDRKTKFRNILNQDALVSALKKEFNDEIELNIVTYDLKTKFVDQLSKTHNSDIFMSMHGAGLTHLLFLPHWATVFEIYNCEDRDCYLDLARLRGVQYFTWERPDLVYPQDEGKHPQLGTPHKKFTNYSFDKVEFVRIVKKMVQHVKSHQAYIKAYKEKYEGANKVEL